MPSTVRRYLPTYLRTYVIQLVVNNLLLLQEIHVFILLWLHPFWHLLQNYILLLLRCTVRIPYPTSSVQNCEFCSSYTTQRYLSVSSLSKTSFKRQFCKISKKLLLVPGFGELCFWRNTPGEVCEVCITSWSTRHVLWVLYPSLHDSLICTFCNKPHTLHTTKHNVIWKISFEKHLPHEKSM